MDQQVDYGCVVWRSNSLESRIVRRHTRYAALPKLDTTNFGKESEEPEEQTEFVRGDIASVDDEPVERLESRVRRNRLRHEGVLAWLRFSQ